MSNYTVKLLEVELKAKVDFFIKNDKKHFSEKIVKRNEELIVELKTAIDILKTNMTSTPVFIFRNNDGTLIVEAFKDRKGNYQHNEAVIMNLEKDVDFEKYCIEFNYEIINK